MEFKILSDALLPAFRAEVDFDLATAVSAAQKDKTPFEYFKFYNALASVYSSKIEGEEVEPDSYLKHKFMQVEFQPDYTKKADDLNAAYEMAETEDLTAENLLKAHKLISANLLRESQRGTLRKGPMFVMNEDDRIEYVACRVELVKSEFEKLFEDIRLLIETDLGLVEAFYYAAYIHLVFLKIHPMSDGNGRTARMLEKWFLAAILSNETATAISLEKNYYRKKPQYYNNIRKIGLEYSELDYSKSLDFLLMTVKMFEKKQK